MTKCEGQTTQKHGQENANVGDQSGKQENPEKKLFEKGERTKTQNQRDLMNR